MKFLTKLNPINSLFGRIFLWFWLSAIVLIIGNLWIGKQLSENSEVKPAVGKQSKELAELASHLSTVAARIEGPLTLPRLLNRVGRNKQILLMLVEPVSKRYFFDFPRHIRPRKELITPLVEQSTIYQVRTVRSEFFGPVNVELAGTNYKLFAGRVAPRGAFGFLQRSNPMLFLSIALAISAALCALLTWSLLKPIRQIKSATHKMATGNLAARVGSTSERHDELGQLGREFNSMAQQVESLMQSQKRLLADVSHELRSPLARLQVAIGIAQQELSDTQQGPWQSQLTRIEKESLRIEQMLARVMMLARLEGAAKMHKTSVSLNSLLTETLTDSAFEAEHQSKSLLHSIEPEIRLHADPELIHSAIENVLRNAIKYASSSINVQAFIKAGFVVINIDDDGPGVPEEDLESIFNAFYRVSLSRNRDSGGTGLGLAIASQAIAAHSGEVQASNKPEGGLSVNIRIPLV